MSDPDRVLYVYCHIMPPRRSVREVQLSPFYRQESGAHCTSPVYAKWGVWGGKDRRRESREGTKDPLLGCSYVLRKSRRMRFLIRGRAAKWCILSLSSLSRTVGFIFISKTGQFFGREGRVKTRTWESHFLRLQGWREENRVGFIYSLFLFKEDLEFFRRGVEGVSQV